jgi:hypothetical protein
VCAEEDDRSIVMDPNSASMPSVPYSLDLGSAPLSSLFERPEEYALSFFFTFYACPPTSPHDRRGFFEYVAPLYLRASENSTPKMSTIAVASVMFLAWMDRRPDEAMSRGYLFEGCECDEGAVGEVGNPGLCI